MNEEKKQLIKNLLNSVGKKCTDMTHNLSELGGGDMAEGLVTLYRSGQLNGVVIGAGSVTALVAAYHVGKAIIEGVKTQIAIRQMTTQQDESILASSQDDTAELPTCPQEAAHSLTVNACDLPDTNAVTNTVSDGD